MRSRCIILILPALVMLTFGLENITLVDDFDNTMVGLENITLVDDLDNRIVGGTLAKIRRFPSVVSIHIIGFGMWCGGTLITRRFVISAAHCFVGIPILAPEFYTRAGSSLNHRGGAVSLVSKTYPHPKYNRQLLDYDIAIVKLKYGYPQAVLDRYPINYSGISSKQPGKWTKCWTVGWGANREGGGTLAKLHKAQVKIISRTLCNTETASAGRITARIICAGVLKGGKGVCSGDSGGPLFHNRRLVGVVSGGYGCAKPNAPAQYTNVGYFNKWIRMVVAHL